MSAASEARGSGQGLRALKKARTRDEIQRHAIRLFRDQGYDATTVEQIAAAAEVSPSTFFRYFPTKEDVVLRDDYDRLMLESFRDQPPELTPLQAARAAVRALASRLGELSPEELELERWRAALQFSVPQIRAHLIDESLRGFQEFAEVVAQRVGNTPDSLPVCAFTGALMGVMLGSYLPLIGELAALDPMGSDGWRVGLDLPDLVERLDAAIEFLEKGLPL